MDHAEDLLLQVQAMDSEEQLAEAAQRLRAQLLTLEVDSVEPYGQGLTPAGAKGLAAVVGWLTVRLGNEGLGSLVAAVAAWATRTGHSIEIIYDGDVLKVSGVTAAQQQRVIDDFLARHAPRS
jgi:hypothetical protein